MIFMLLYYAVKLMGNRPRTNSNRSRFLIAFAVVFQAELNRQFRFAKEKRISFRTDLQHGGAQASSSRSSSPKNDSSSLLPCKPQAEGRASLDAGGSARSSGGSRSTNSLDSSTSSDEGDGDGDSAVTALNYGLEEGVWGAAGSCADGTSTGPDALVFRISTLLLLGSLYVAAFLLRYAEVATKE